MNFVAASRRAVDVFFLFYFLMYAGSPLTCAVPGKTDRERTYAAVGEKGIHVMLWELVLDTVSSRHEASDTRERDVLIKKKRGLIPEDVAAKVFPSKRAFSPPTRYTPPAPLTERYESSPVIHHGIAAGFKPLYAGHSPPSAV